MLARPGYGLLTRLHPVTRLMLAAPVVALLPVAGPWPLAGATLGFLGWGFASGIGGVMVRRMAVVLLPVALALAVVHGLLIARGPGVPLGPLTLYPEGLARAGMILLRLAALLSAGLLIVISTPPGTLADGLEDKGLPPGAAYLLTAPLSLAEGLAQEAAALRDALQVRGLPFAGNPFRRLRVLWHLVIALVRVQLVEAAPRAQALEARGFRALPRRALLSPPADTPAQARLRLACAAAVPLILLAGLLWG